MNTSKLTSSFRDPSGFLFQKDKIILRQVNQTYKDNYDQLMRSGLYESLIAKRWMIEHKEVSADEYDNAYKILQPVQIRYISYPYEWSFSQLKDAALLTIDIQIEAMKYGMSLKDASAYNIQFHKGRAVFIDTLSFEKFQKDKPWVAYRQYCQHFLGPLALMSYRDHRLSRLLIAFIDGPPLDLVSKLLPLRSWLKYSILAHIHLHARVQNKFENAAIERKDQVDVSIKRTQLEGLIASLRKATDCLVWKYPKTEWGGYYRDTNYGDDAMTNKERLVSELLRKYKPSRNPVVADIGANTGRFSRLAAKLGYYVIAHDIDEVAVDVNYREVTSRSDVSILPLIQDLTNPSPSIGWANKERMSFVDRQNIDVCMALALVHHLAISNNVPFSSISSFFSEVCKYLIIEFVPKTDSQVIRLLSSREDIFDEYCEKEFEQVFSQDFTLLEKEKLDGSERTLYVFKRR